MAGIKRELIDDLFSKFEKAKIACGNSDGLANDHFVDLNKMIEFGKKERVNKTAAKNKMKKKMVKSIFNIKRCFVTKTCHILE
jgi:hypothetical protein